jgi:hypothetical protein
MSNEELEGLEASMKKFGDLSGFIYNIRTKVMLGGHQKKKLVKSGGKITITSKFDSPTEARTVAEGFVEVFGERYKYREVDADETWEKEAMIAANKHSGHWDGDLLRLIGSEGLVDWKLVGFNEAELRDLKISVPEVKIESLGVNSAPTSWQSSFGGDEEETDEQYMRNNAGPDEYAQKEQIPSMVNESNPFEQIEEQQEVVGKRIVIIIDCPSEEVKKSLKEKLRNEVNQCGASFF